MKKIKYLAVFAMLMVMAVFSAHSQNANGAELLQKGKDYEAKKEYIYALGCYYDAMEAGGESAAEAKTAFDTLSGYIREGRPGPGTYNEFTLHDGWGALLQNAEKYWTENCPWQFMFKIGNRTVDYATRTGSYDLIIDVVFKYYDESEYRNRSILNSIPKYDAIVYETIFEGLDKAWKGDWTDIPWSDSSGYWPHRSVYTNAQGKYLQNGSALFDYNRGICCAWRFGIGGDTSLYDMKVAICDLSGKELIKSERILYGERNNKYTFSGVSPSIMDMIDNEQITIKITDLYLEYGKYNWNDDKGGRTFIKNLPEMKLNVSPANGIALDLLPHDEIVTIPYVFMKHVGAKSFINENKIAKINIPFGVTSIENSAFSGCESLTSVNISYGITSIGHGAFSGCESLTSVNISYGITSIGYDAFKGCESLTSVTIPDSVTSIGSEAFSGCSSLASVTIPDSVTSIGNYAFRGCKSLTSVTISGDLKYNIASIFDYPINVTVCGVAIKNNAFTNCKFLKNVTIQDSVTSIGNYAFSSCKSLTSVTIPNGVTEIGKGAFYGCTLLTSMTISGQWNIASIFNSLTNVTVRGSVISSGAFKDCYSLKSVTILDGVAAIGSASFVGCSALTSVSIPNSVTSIGNDAFENCYSLMSVTIPDSVTSIDRRAFRYNVRATYKGVTDTWDNIYYKYFR